MNKPVLALAVAAVLLTGTAFAQEAPLRGVGLLALNAASDASGGLGNTQSRGALVETPDSGGGGVGARSGRGAGDVGPAAKLPRPSEPASHALPDELPPAAMLHGDPATPAAATPKRPTYRWQSLVPGAIK